MQSLCFDRHRVAKTSQIPFIFPSFDMVLCFKTAPLYSSSNDFRAAMKHATCHQQKSKVPSSVNNFPLWTATLQTFSPLCQQLQSSTTESPCCPYSKMLDTIHQFLLAATDKLCKKLMHEMNQFHQILCTLPKVQHFPAVANKEASSLLFGARSQQMNSTLKHSRSALNLSFSLSHSLTSFSCDANANFSR